MARRARALQASGPARQAGGRMPLRRLGQGLPHGASVGGGWLLADGTRGSKRGAAMQACTRSRLRMGARNRTMTSGRRRPSHCGGVAGTGQTRSSWGRADAGWRWGGRARGHVPPRTTSTMETEAQYCTEVVRATVRRVSTFLAGAVYARVYMSGVAVGVRAGLGERRPRTGAPSRSRWAGAEYNTARTRINTSETGYPAPKEYTYDTRV